jgi:hypothetical protein
MAHRPVSVIAVLVVLAALTAACGPSPGPEAASGSPGGSTAPAGPSATPDPEAIVHPTGATDVLLRVTETGGFVPMDHAMANVPLFTMYGDGRVLVVASAGEAAGAPKGAPGMLGNVPVLLETRLDEAGVQAILAAALTDGRLGIAKPDYAAAAFDLPTTVFEIRAGGIEKTVSVGGLVAEPQPGPDAPVLAGLAELASRLRLVRAEAPYDPPAWVAVIAEWERDPAQPAAADWPWPDIPPDAFVQPGDADPVPFPRHLMTREQAEAAGADPSAGGAAGLLFEGPDGRLYVAALRAALPEEVAGG